jgi:predicted dehydrogenase
MTGIVLEIKLKIKVGVIGCGRVAEHYLKLHSLNLTPWLEYASWFDLDFEKSKTFQERFGGVAYKSLDEFLLCEENCAVLVLTPSGDHFKTCLEVIKYKKHVLIEKPICLKVEEAEKLREMAIKNQIVLMTVLQNRYNESILKFNELKINNKIGKILSGGLRLRWGRDKGYYSDGWHGTWSMDGGVVAQQAIHHIFAVDSLIGPIEKVYATSLNVIHEIEAEDTCLGLFELSNKSIVTFELTTSSRKGDFEACISLLTEEGVYEISGIALNNLEFTDNYKNIPLKIIEREVESGYGFGHIDELKNFVEAIKNHSTGYTGIEDGVRALKLVHAIYASVEQKVWIKVDSSKAKSTMLGRDNGK